MEGRLERQNISTISYFKGNYHDLFNPNEKYCFLVGAGASMDPPARIPSAREMGKILLESCAMGKEGDSLINIPSLRYEMIVEQIKLFLDSELKFLDYFDNIRSPNLIHYFLANMIIVGHSVITTNFDYCIERALISAAGGESQKDKIFLIITKEDYKNFESDPTIATNKFVLAKIHGSKKNIVADSNTAESLVTTISSLGKDRESGKTFAIEPYKKATIESLTRDRTLVVLGYSGSDDFDIVPALRELRGLKGIIWIEHTAGEDRGQQVVKSESLLAEVGKMAGIPITIVRAHTGELIRTSIWEIMLPKLAQPSLQDLSETKTLSFREFAESIFENSNELDKYELTSRLYFYLDRYDDVLRISEKGLELAKTTRDLRIQADFLNHIGMIYEFRGDYDKALYNYNKALEIDEQLGDLSGKATRLSNIGLIYKSQGNYDKALKNYNEALRIDEQLGNLLGKAIRLNNIGMIYEFRGDYDKALENYNEALRIDEQLGDLPWKAIQLSNIGGIYYSRGEYDKALEKYSDSLKIDEQLGNLLGKSTSLNNIGLIYKSQGRYDKAFENFAEALKISEQFGNLPEKAKFLNNIGNIYRARGEYDKAFENFAEALKITERLGDLSGKATSLNNIGLVYYIREDYDKAFKNFTEALKIDEQLGDLSGKASRLNNIGLIYEIKGEYNIALENYNKALEIDEQLGDLSGKASHLNNIGQIYKAQGNYDKALENYNKALKINEQLGDLSEIACCLNNIGSIYYIQQNYKNALSAFQKALNFNTQLGALVDIASNNFWIAIIYKEQGKRDKAIIFSLQAYELYRKLGLQKNEEQVKEFIRSIK